VTANNQNPLALRDVFRDARRVLTRQGLLLLLLSFVLVFPAGFAAAWFRHHPLFAGANFFPGMANGVVAWLAQMAPSSLFVAASTWIVVRTLEDRPPALGETLWKGVRFTAPVFAIQALYTLGMLAGMVLLLVPGIILALMWVLAVPVLVIERTGIVEAFGRSRVLTKGHRWTLLGLMVGYALIVFALEWLAFRVTAGGMSFVLAAQAPLNSYGVIPVLGALTSPVSMAMTTVIYLHLQNGHRGAADAAAEVFA
jgi:hypothetical protein